MAQIFPRLQSCLGRMQAGERRFAQRLSEHLEDDYLCWYDVPVGPKQFHPDFIILNPHRGVLVIEVKDWRRETFTQQGDRYRISIHTPRGVVSEGNPMETARTNSMLVETLLRSSPALRNPTGHPYEGKLVMPYGWGVALTHITRSDFEELGLGTIMDGSRVICRDEMQESTDPMAFQQRLWNMFSVSYPCLMTLPQINHVRSLLFPELSLGGGPCQFGLLPAEASPLAVVIPELIRVMDLQQEQLARSLGEGHRVIHGVAGSGKTMILAYRCLHLSKALSKPILVLCYNVTLAARLKSLLHERASSLHEKVHVYSFHDWCGTMLDAYQVAKPKHSGDSNAYNSTLVEACTHGVDLGRIPRAQYGAVMIDEGHDFEADWLRLAVQMVDPTSNSVLVLYDDAQAIYAKREVKKFSFSSVGIQAQGRTTILKLNYRNTLEILAVAKAFAEDVLQSIDVNEDSMPTIAPESAGRRGRIPEIVSCTSAADEAETIALRIAAEIADGRMPQDIAVLTHGKHQLPAIEAALRRHHINFATASNASGKRALFNDPTAIKLVTLHSSKGLEFGLGIVPLAARKPKNDQEVLDETRLLYVGMTRATERLIFTHIGSSVYIDKLSSVIRQVSTTLAVA